MIDQFLPLVCVSCEVEDRFQFSAPNVFPGLVENILDAFIRNTEIFHQLFDAFCGETILYWVAPGTVNFFYNDNGGCDSLVDWDDLHPVQDLHCRLDGNYPGSWGDLDLISLAKIEEGLPRTDGNPGLPVKSPVVLADNLDNDGHGVGLSNPEVAEEILKPPRNTEDPGPDPWHGEYLNVELVKEPGGEVGDEWMNNEVLSTNGNFSIKHFLNFGACRNTGGLDLSCPLGRVVHIPAEWTDGPDFDFGISECKALGWQYPWGVDLIHKPIHLLEFCEGWVE